MNWDKNNNVVLFVLTGGKKEGKINQLLHPIYRVSGIKRSQIKGTLRLNLINQVVKAIVNTAAL